MAASAVGLCPPRRRPLALARKHPSRRAGDRAIGRSLAGDRHRRASRCSASSPCSIRCRFPLGLAHQLLAFLLLALAIRHLYEVERHIAGAVTMAAWSERSRRAGPGTAAPAWRTPACAGSGAAGAAQARAPDRPRASAHADDGPGAARARRGPPPATRRRSVPGAAFPTIGGSPVAPERPATGPAPAAVPTAARRSIVERPGSALDELPSTTFAAAALRGPHLRVGACRVTG